MVEIYVLTINHLGRFCLCRALARSQSERIPQLQSKLYKKIFEQYDYNNPLHWHVLIHRRLRDFGLTVSRDETATFLQNTSKVLRKIKPRWRGGVAFMFLQTLANSWSTTYRYRNKDDTVLLPCIFGCEDCKDELKHYLQCDPLWTTVLTCLHTDVKTITMGVERSQRLGIPNPDYIGILIIALMFKAYHALRNDYQLIVFQSVEDADFNPVLARVRWLVRIYAEEFGITDLH